MYASIAIGYAVWVALYRRVRGVAPSQQAALGSSAMSCAEGRVFGSVGRAGRLVPRRQRVVHPVRELRSTGAEAEPLKMSSDTVVPVSSSMGKLTLG